MTDCQACRRIAESRSGSNPFLIAELRESLAVLHDHQAYEGWCVLLLKEHVEHLHLLSAARRAALNEDMGRVAEAIVRAFSPRRINYECLGNQMHHVHWHVIPRYEAPIDPEPKMAIWVRPAGELESGVDPKRRVELISRLRGAGLG
ncbi:MAG TPA: HIT family protein [Phycisphaerales bacterium]|nr:HIT family protein [Phycisphaerales bacterium]